MEGIEESCARLLYGSGLFSLLGEYGEAHVVGSFVMNTMAERDLDIDVLNDTMSDEKLYRLTGELLAKYRPLWYEAKRDITDEGKTVWFHGFELEHEGERWNVDIWFFDRETISKAESFCSAIKRRLDGDAALRSRIIAVKKELIARGLYAFDKYNSMDVYAAVLERGAKCADEVIADKNSRGTPPFCG